MAAADLYYLAAIALIGLVSLDRSGRVGPLVARWLSGAAWRWSAGKRLAALRSVQRAFGSEKSAAQREQVVRGSLRGFWLELLDWMPSAGGEARQRGAAVVGLEHLDRALEAGAGVILWESNGFGARLAAKQALRRRGYALHQLHGRLNLGGFLTDDASGTWVRRTIVRRIFLRLERRFMVGAIDIPERGTARFGRTLASLLRQNQVVCVAADGKEGRHRLPLTFLRHQVSFSTGMCTLARVSGAPLMPLIAVRDPLQGPRVVIGPPLASLPTLDRDRANRACLEQFALLLESYVRRYPDQYRNWHLLEAAPAPASSEEQPESG